jgi:hypothetical protein
MELAAPRRGADRVRGAARGIATVAPLLAAEVGLIWFWLYLPFSQTPFDFPIYYQGAAAWLRGLDPYERSSLDQAAAALGIAPASDAFTNPPILAMLIAPLVRLGSETAFAIFHAVSVASYLAALFLAIRLSADRGAMRRWAIGFVVAWPVVLSLRLGQVDALMTVAVTLSCGALAGKPRGSALLAGLPIGLAGGIKILPLVVLPYLLATRRWAALGWGSLGLAVTIALPTLVSGIWLPVSFVTHLGYYGRKLSAMDNVSAMGILARIHYQPTQIWEVQAMREEPLPLPLALAGLAFAVTTLAWAVWTSRRLPPARAYLLLVAAVLIAAPIAWDHYLAWLLPFLMLALVELRPSRGRWWPLLVAAALLCVPLGRLPVEFPLLALAPLRTGGLVLVLAAIAPRGSEVGERGEQGLGVLGASDRDADAAGDARGAVVANQDAAVG